MLRRGDPVARAVPVPASWIWFVFAEVFMALIVPSANAPL